jgi:hypothetical protein
MASQGGSNRWPVNTYELTRLYFLAIQEGNSLRGTGRIVDVDKDTVCAWLERAGRPCRAVTSYLFDTLHITECQVDELWSFVRKKESTSHWCREGPGALR